MRTRVKAGLLVMGMVMVGWWGGGRVGAEEDERVRIRPQVMQEERLETRMQLREAVRQTREEFRQRLVQVRDERKRELVELLDLRMCDINRRRTAMLTQHLGKMKDILTRVETRAKELEARGGEVGAVYRAIEVARKAIDEAQAAVSAQAGAACGVVISGGEAGLGADVRRGRLELESGLRAVQAKVAAARQAVGAAIRALAAAWGETLPEGEGT